MSNYPPYNRIRFEPPFGLDIYRVQDVWKVRRGVLIRGARRFWHRTWQAEWDGCRRAVRAFTRNGALIKACRAASALAMPASAEGTALRGER